MVRAAGHAIVQVLDHYGSLITLLGKWALLLPAEGWIRLLRNKMRLNGLFPCLAVGTSRIGKGAVVARSAARFLDCRPLESSTPGSTVVVVPAPEP